MRKLSRTVWIIAVAILCLLGLMVWDAMAATGIYTNRGEISGIDIDFNTVVVEIPVDGQLMTVGGPLVEDVELKKGNRPATLRDFTVGETVTVKWRYTESGHRILGVYGR
jgi:hypothetical protein